MLKILLIIVFWLGIIGAAVKTVRDRRERERLTEEAAARRQALDARIEELCEQGEREAAERIARREREGSAE